MTQAPLHQTSQSLELSRLGEHGDLPNVEIGDREVVIACHEDFDSVGMHYNDTGALGTRVEFGRDGDRGWLARLETLKAQAY